MNNKDNITQGDSISGAPDIRERFLPLCYTLFLGLTALIFFGTAFDPFEPGKTAVIRISCVLMLLAWAGSAVLKHGAEKLKTSADSAFLFFIAWCALSFFYTPHPAATFNQFAKICCWAALFQFTATHVRSRAAAEKIVLGAMAVSIIVAAMGLLELLRVDWFPWDWLLSNPFYSVFSGMDHAGYAPPAWDNIFDGRISSTIGNPVYLAGYLVLLIPVTLAMCLGARGRCRAAFSFAALAAQIFALAATFSRSGWAVCALTVAVFFALAFAYGAFADARLVVRRMLYVALFTLLAAAVFSFPNPLNTSRFSVAQRVTGFSVRRDNSFKERYLIWKSTVEMIKQHPVRGVGLGNFAPAYPVYQKKFYSDKKWLKHISFPTRAHNDPLEMWAETGVIGFCLFIWLMAMVMRPGLRRPSEMRARAGRGREAGLLIAGFVCGLAAVFMYSMFQFPMHVEGTAAHFWVFAGLLAAVAAIEVEERTAAFTSFAAGGAARRGSTPEFILGSVLLGLAFIFLAGLALRPLKSSLLFDRAVRLEDKSHPGYVLDLIEAAERQSGFTNDMCIETGALLLTRAHETPEERLKAFYYGKAAERAAMCLKTNPNDSRTWAILGRVYLEMGMPDKAVNTYGKAVELNPFFPEAFYSMGIAYSKQGRYNDSVKLYLKSIEVSPDFVLAYVNLGDAYSKMGRRAAAEKAYLAALKIDPKLYYVHNTLGSLRQEAGDTAAAEAHYKKAIALAPDFLDVRGNLAILYYKAGRYAEAERLLKYVLSRAQEGTATGTLAAYHLGESFAAQGRRDEAVSAFRRALSSVSESRHIQKRLDEVLSENAHSSRKK